MYSYFLQKGKAKIRLYYEWLPLTFIVKTLGGEILIIDDSDDVKYLEDIELLTRDNVLKIHTTTCGGLIGNEKAVNLFLSL